MLLYMAWVVGWSFCVRAAWFGCQDRGSRSRWRNSLSCGAVHVELRRIIPSGLLHLKDKSAHLSHHFRLDFSSSFMLFQCSDVSHRFWLANALYFGSMPYLHGFVCAYVLMHFCYIHCDYNPDLLKTSVATKIILCLMSAS